jgi:hypothetical protein
MSGVRHYLTPETKNKEQEIFKNIKEKKELG